MDPSELSAGKKPCKRGLVRDTRTGRCRKSKLGHRKSKSVYSPRYRKNAPNRSRIQAIVNKIRSKSPGYYNSKGHKLQSRPSHGVFYTHRSDGRMVRFDGSKSRFV